MDIDDSRGAVDDLPGVDSRISSEDSIAYWNSISPDVNGMLGGYPQISRIDLQGSINFIRKVNRLNTPQTTRSTGDDRRGENRNQTDYDGSKKLKLGVDCGAGIGRVTTGCLLHVCDQMDVVEPVDKFASVLRDGPQKASGQIDSVFVVGLESWTPPASKRYDLVWNQWCLGHLTDQQLAEYFSRVKDALSDHGWMGIKENMSTRLDGEDIFDELDSSVTRSDETFRRLLEKSGWKIIRTELQTGFPKGLGLYPVRMYAVRPR